MTISRSTESGYGGTPNFQRPGSIFDLVNFRAGEFLGYSGSIVTRLCEGQFGVTREEWQIMAMLAALGPMSPSELAERTTIDRGQCSRTPRGLMNKRLTFRRRVRAGASTPQSELASCRAASWRGRLQPLHLGLQGLDAQLLVR